MADRAEEQERERPAQIALDRLDRIADVVATLAYAVGCGLEGTRTAKNIRDAVATVRAALLRGSVREERPSKLRVRQEDGKAIFNPQSFDATVVDADGLVVAEFVSKEAADAYAGAPEQPGSPEQALCPATLERDGVTYRCEQPAGHLLNHVQRLGHAPHAWKAWPNVGSPEQEERIDEFGEWLDAKCDAVVRREGIGMMSNVACEIREKYRALLLRPQSSPEAP